MRAVGWRALTGAVLLDFAVSPLFVWDTFTASLAVELRVPTSFLSIVYGVGLAAFTVGVLIGGRIADRLPPRRIAALCTGGVVAGLGLSAVATTLPLVVAGFGVLLGGATGVGYATAIRVAGTASSRRGTAVALVVSAYAAGAVVLAPVVEVLLSRIGRAGTFAVLAVLVGILLVGASALLPGTVPTSAATPVSVSSVLRQHRRPLLVFWAMFLLGSGPALVALGQAGQLAQGPELAFVAVLLLNAGNFAGRLLAGPIADRWGPTPVLHVAAVALIGASAVLTMPDRPALALGALLVLGLQYGAVSVLVPVALHESVPSEHFGTAWGIVFSGWGLVGLLGPVAAAALGEETSYRTVAGVLVGVGVAFWMTVARGSTVVRTAP